MKEVSFMNVDGSMDDLEGDQKKVFESVKSFERETKFNVLKDFLADPILFLLGDDVMHPQYVSVCIKYNCRSACVRSERIDGNASLIDTDNHHNIFRFSNNWRNFEDFPWVTTAHGKCISIDLNKEGQGFQAVPGPEGGLIIDLDARLYEYLPFTATKGFMLYLRNPNETLVSFAPLQSYYHMLISLI